MQTRILELPLDAFGAHPRPARVEIAVLSLRERLRRAGLAFGALLAVALIAIPIPLVHFVLVPGALVAAVALGLVRLRQREVFRSAQGACPLCAADQSFTIMGRFRLPRTLHCSACGRELQLG